jgi:energy-coupling factor transporter ATP-binding protein EcfA2
MLQTIELIDFKNHVDTKIRLQRLTLLVGPNGAGKTGVLQGIDLATALIRTSATTVLREQSNTNVTRRGCDAFRLSLSGESLVYDVDPDDEFPWSLEIKVLDTNARERSGQIRFKDRNDELEAELASLNKSSSKTLFIKARAALGSSVMLRLDATKLAAPSYLGSVDAAVKPDGYGLASTIAHLMTYERERFSTLEQSLIELIPSVRSIRVRRVEIADPKPSTSAGRNSTPQKVLGDELVLDMRSGKELPASALSEGTMILLGLLTFLTEREPPRLLLIDDLDRSLHPRAQTQLIDLLRKTLDQHPDLQIVATSHSPYLIDELNDDEVWVLNLRDDGTAAAACLADHPDAERFRGVLRTGEFLSSVGEDWVIGPDE